MRLQWISRLLANPLLDAAQIMAPFARQQLSEAAANGQVVVLSMDQTELGNRCAILIVSVRVGDRALPLIWAVEAGSANLGFKSQQVLLEIVRDWLPNSASVLFAADRFYPSAPLFTWLKVHGWHYRPRLKGNHALDVGCADITNTKKFASGFTQSYAVSARLSESGIETNIGVLHESGHKEPWIVAMDCIPNAASVRDYGLRWCIEPMFSDFKSRGFGLEDTQLRYPERGVRLVLMMALALYWCVDVGGKDTKESPTPLEKKVAK